MSDIFTFVEIDKEKSEKCGEIAKQILSLKIPEELFIGVLSLVPFYYYDLVSNKHDPEELIKTLELFEMHFTTQIKFTCEQFKKAFFQEAKKNWN